MMFGFGVSWSIGSRSRVGWWWIEFEECFFLLDCKIVVINAIADEVLVDGVGIWIDTQCCGIVDRYGVDV